MLSKNDEQNGIPNKEKALEILHEFLESEDLKTHNENLHDFMIAFVHYYYSPSNPWKKSMMHTYMALRTFFIQLNEIN